MTITEVAKQAGVSIATVSRALATPELVSAAARARVLDAVSATGYMPNFAARNLRAGRTMLVLVVVPNIGNPFFAEIMRGIDDALSAEGYGMIIGNLDNRPDREARYVELVLAGRVDAVLIMSGRVPTGGRRTMTDSGLPIASVGVAIPGTGLPHAVVGDVGAAREVAGHFTALGHRRFGIISGPAFNVTWTDRRAGFRAGLVDAGFDPDADLIEFAGAYDFRSGTAAADTFLALGPGERPTAVFAASDMMAISFMKAVSAAGVRVPEDLSVVGFDGVEVGSYCVPTLTTVHQPQYDLGQAGARLVLEGLAGRPMAETVMLKAELTLGGSTGPARLPQRLWAPEQALARPAGIEPASSP